MGPAEESAKSRGISDPPLFNPGQDLLIWRKRVATWVDLISTAAEKGRDKLYKTVYATLARQLYDRGLRQVQKSLVDEAQAKPDNNFDYKQDDQVLAVKQIVDLVATDPPIAVVTRLIDSFNKVVNCRRRPKEDLNNFVSRYRGLAAEHLMRAGATSSSQVGEVLAITQLNNASLPETTLTNAKLQLIQLAASRNDPALQGEYVKVPLKDIKTIIDSTSIMTELLDDFALYKSETRKKIVKKSLIAVREWKTAIAEMDAARLCLIQQRDRIESTSAETIVNANVSRCVLHLDDAMSVMRSLAQTIPKGESDILTPKQVKAVEEHVKCLWTTQSAALSTTTKGNSGPSRSSRPKRRRESQSTTSKPSKRSRSSARNSQGSRITDLIGRNQCRDCGSHSHVRGDPECKEQSFMTRKLAEAKEIAEESKSHDDNSRPVEYFRPGSQHPKGKGA